MGHRRSKTVILLEELAGKIRSGFFPPGSTFPTKEELTLQFRISSGSAGKIIRELKLLNLLDVARGRKSKVSSCVQVAPPPQLDKPVGIVGAVSESARFSRWRDALLHGIQRKFFAHGNQSMLLPMDFNLENIEKNYSGIIFACESIQAEKWQYLLDAGIPCARISFLRPFPNSVYLDYRLALDQIALHMAKNNCRRTIYLTAHPPEGAGGESLIQRHVSFFETLDEYGIRKEDRSHLLVIPGQNIGLDCLQKEISRRDDKIAFLASCSSYKPHIMKMMEKYGRQLHKDYEIYSFSFIANEIHFGHGIDSKYTVLAERLVNMFYRQITLEKRQVGEIVLAEYLPPA